MKTWEKTLLSFLFLTQTSCEELNPFPDIMKFYVKENSHYYFGPKLIAVSKNTFHFEAYIPESQIHPKYEKEECNGDWNKLFGASADFFGSHQDNSARFVFRPIYEENKIEIGHYTYYKGKIQKNKWTTKIPPNKYYEYEIKFKENTVEYYFQEELVQTDSISNVKDLKMILEPYQGGDCGAYQDSYIIIKEK